MSPLTLDTTIGEDREFFRVNPDRRFRARPPSIGEKALINKNALQDKDELGKIRRINFVIVENICELCIRIRRYIATASRPTLKDDAQILAYLRFRESLEFDRSGSGGLQ